MGKSLGNAIYLCDDDETIKKKVMSAVTDPNKIKKDDPANPDVCMVYYYHKIINDKNIDTICSECKKGQRGCVQCKKELINNINEFLSEYREKRKYYESHKEEVLEILKEGTEAAQKRASETLYNVKKNMKLDYFL